MKAGRMLALALSAAAGLGAHSGVLIDEDVNISAAKVRPLEFEIATAHARVLCTFHVQSGRSGVRLALLDKSEERKWLNGRPNHVLAATGYSESGGFSAAIERPGEYAIMIDNRMEGREGAVVRLQVRIVSSAGAAAAVRLAEPRRAEILVWGSVLLFGVLASVSGWRIALGLRRRAAEAPRWNWPAV